MCPENCDAAIGKILKAKRSKPVNERNQLCFFFPPLYKPPAQETRSWACEP